MPKPKKTERHVFRIEVTPQTARTIAGISETLGITQIAIASKLMLWFDKQTPLVQQAILGTYPDKIGKDVGELLMREMARSPNPRISAD